LLWLCSDDFKKIVYAKGASNVIAKLRGTYVAPAAGAGPSGVSTDLQKSIFSGPPGTVPVQPATEVNGESHGVKRPREEESDEGEAPMEEDSDVPMEASSDED
jgi:U2 small nuclear ribonucleoprotein B''